jgi:hypothetical protein
MLNVVIEVNEIICYMAPYYCNTCAHTRVPSYSFRIRDGFESHLLNTFGEFHGMVPYDFAF